MGFPWQPSLSTEIPTVGDRMRSLGQHATYLGKWHMSQEFEDIETKAVPDADLVALNELMNQHGFSDYLGVGDIIGTTLPGGGHGLVIPQALELATVQHARARVRQYAPRPGRNSFPTCQF